ncbi:hypothetical protein GM418_23800 [Maribellus comscasis]|uniref:Sulfotransferase domain-containing protein n=1 Tax=Maribellus comscasis TaxID=2681766 RepID=A0A6I6K2B0_9BACT|nr:sulfotransferase domain-containing protein [Maribellus comscasis]QGY46572.1 hypothetical protein GM418_23800 [Maribellus comscasis]
MVLLLRKIFDYLYSYAGISSDDIILASFPKAGNTWVKFFLFNYLIEYYNLKNSVEINFDTLDKYMPELGNKTIYESWRFKPTKRILKTHNRNSFLLRNVKVIYIDREPRDIMVSYYHYTKNNRNFSHNLDFSSFIHSKKYGIEAYYKHRRSYLSHSNIVILSYEELKQNPQKQFEKILKFIGIEIKEDIVKSALNQSSFNNTKLAQKNSSEGYNYQFARGFSFARKGQKEQWTDYFSKEDINYYLSIKSKYRNE